MAAGPVSERNQGRDFSKKGSLSKIISGNYLDTFTMLCGFLSHYPRNFRCHNLRGRAGREGVRVAAVGTVRAGGASGQRPHAQGQGHNATPGQQVLVSSWARRENNQDT